jgi:hypothetical protein
LLLLTGHNAYKYNILAEISMNKMPIINDNNSNNGNKDKKGLVLLLSIVGSVLIASIACFSSVAYAQIPSFSNDSVPDNVSGTAKMNFTGIAAQGSIASLQNNQSGQPTWLLTGRWNMTKTTTDLPIFDALFTMTKLDGSMKHRHTISTKDTSNGTMTGNVASANSAFNGTATVSMDKGSIVRDVPISIKLMHGVMSLWVDPSKVSNHFGNTPIYGSAIRR